MARRAIKPKFAALPHDPDHDETHTHYGDQLAREWANRSHAAISQRQPDGIGPGAAERASMPQARSTAATCGHTYAISGLSRPVPETQPRSMMVGQKPRAWSLARSFRPRRGAVSHCSSKPTASCGVG